MKIKLASDLHLEHLYPTETVNLGSGDVLVLAGDILTAKPFKTNGYLNQIYTRFLNDCSKNFNHIFYILGNHEHYGYCFDHTCDKLKEILPDNFHLLNNDKVVLGDWVFMGATLWTDHHKANPIYMMENALAMNDYKTIRITSKYRKLSPEDTLKEHRKSIRYFETELENHKNDKVFMITHMAPSWQSVPQEYKTSTCNSAYVSDLDDWILERPQIKFWTHGHTHDSFDYPIGECRVICNPHGYRGENTNFNPNFEIEI